MFWLGVLTLSIYIVDQHLFNNYPSEEDIANKRFWEESVEDSSRMLEEAIFHQKDMELKYQKAEEEYQKILEKNKDYKIIVREHECGVNDRMCEKDENGNFLKYKDLAGVSTICYGNTSFPRKYPDIEKLSKRECEFLLDEDIDKKIAIFKSDDLYKKHKKEFDSHPATLFMYIDVIFFVGPTGFKFKKNKDGTYSDKPTDTYKEALKDPLSSKTLALMKTYNRVNGEENKGLIKRHHKNQEIAKLERVNILEEKKKKKNLSLNEYFNYYSGI